MKYDADSNGLVFDGKNDYLELEKPGNFSEGFTFEYYGTFDRWLYSNDGRQGYEAVCPLFCKTKDLLGEPGDALRFNFVKNPGRDVCVSKVIHDTDACGEGRKLYVNPNEGSVRIKDNSYDEKGVGEKVYITVTYEVGGGNKVQGDVARIG